MTRVVRTSQGEAVFAPNYWHRPFESGDCDIWLAFPGRVSLRSQLHQYGRLLSADERERMGRFRRSVDRHRFLITRALVRSVLSLYADAEPAEWRFGTDRWGRPFLLNADRLLTSVDFNISHGGGVVAVAVARKGRVGIDCESCVVRRAPMGIATRYFSRAESDYLGSLPEERGEHAFWLLWTLKESFVKAIGCGLSVPLQDLEFEFHDASGVNFHASPVVEPDSARWYFRSFALEDGHLTSVCLEAESGRPPDLRVRVAVPLLGWRPLSCPTLCETRH